MAISAQTHTGHAAMAITLLHSQDAARRCPSRSLRRSPSISLLGNSFESLADLSERVVDFIAYWNAYKAHPFRWTFSGSFVETAERRAA